MGERDTEWFMYWEKSGSGRGRVGEEPAEVDVLLATQGHSDVWVQAAVKDHDLVHGPDVTVGVWG